MLRGEGGLKKLLISAYDRTDRLREMCTWGREGVKNFENFAYVLNGSPPKEGMYTSTYMGALVHCPIESLDLCKDCPSPPRHS